MKKNETIKRCKALAMKNYENGMDAIVECWGDSEWEELYQKSNGSYSKMVKTMKEAAGLWIEQNLNARWGEDDDECLSMLDKKEEDPHATRYDKDLGYVVFADTDKAFKATLSEEEQSQEESMEAEWGCLKQNVNYGDGMMGYNSYEECCNAHTLGIIDMDKF